MSVEHLEFYLHKSHGSGCQHCACIRDAALSKLDRIARCIFQTNFQHYPNSLLGYWTDPGNRLGFFAVLKCRRAVETEYRERQENWL